MQIIPYAGGITFVDREDKPDYQCNSCNKPFWKDNFDSVFIVCEHCGSELKDVTPEEPFRHR